MPAIVALGVLAMLVTGALAAAGTLGGWLLARHPLTRPVAPFSVLVPTASAIGGSLGSWWMGLASHRVENAPPDWSALGWLSGLFAGGSLGLLVGCLLAAVLSWITWRLGARRTETAARR